MIRVFSMIIIVVEGGGSNKEIGMPLLKAAATTAALAEHKVGRFWGASRVVQIVCGAWPSS
jgi:hypothetical protein